MPNETDRSQITRSSTFSKMKEHIRKILAKRSGKREGVERSAWPSWQVRACLWIRRTTPDGMNRLHPS